MVTRYVANDPAFGVADARVSGDFGLCDEVQLELERTRHLLRADGIGQLGTPQVLRPFEGDCH